MNVFFIFVLALVLLFTKSFKQQRTGSYIPNSPEKKTSKLGHNELTSIGVRSYTNKEPKDKGIYIYVL